MKDDPSAASACVIIIGNEILSGRTADANLAFLGRRCDEIGVRLLQARVVGDDEAAIVSSINETRSLYDYVLTTGGIGPTHDDITSAAVAKAFGVPLERNADAVAAMQRYYEQGMLNEARLRMANIPRGARLIDNLVSGAPGFQLDNVFVLPGVPMIMQVMFDGMTDRLRQGPPVLTASITTDLAEGGLAGDLGNLQDLHGNVSIGSYPYFRQGKLGVNLVLRSTDGAQLSAAVSDLEALVNELGGELIGSSRTPTSEPD